jgi:hypothetical protein
MKGKPLSKADKKIKKKCFTISQYKKKSIRRKAKTELLTPETEERLKTLIDIETIEKDGFSHDIWKNLSYEDKCALKQYIGKIFNSMAVEKEGKASHRERHRKIAAEIGKYEKRAIRKFFASKKNEIKQLKEEKNISGTEATDIMWNSLTDDQRHDWLGKQ